MRLQSVIKNPRGVALGPLMSVSDEAFNAGWESGHHERCIRPQPAEAILSIALVAAFADGAKDERERAAIRDVADALDSAGGLNLAARLLSAEARALDIAATGASAFSERAEGLAASVESMPSAVPPATPVPAAAAAPRESDIPRDQMDRMILDASIMNAALELLPESLSTLAIIPLQV